MMKKNKARSRASLTVLVTLLLCAFCFGQPIEDIRISGNYDNVKLTRVLEAIESQSGIAFSYASSDVASVMITYNYHNEPLLSVVTKLLKPNGLAYKVFRQNDNIVVYPASTSRRRQQSNFTVSGYILDKESGEVLVGANIYDVRRQIGTSSNKYGFYSLTLPADSTVLAAAYLGYRTELFNQKLDRDVQLNIHLAPQTVKGDTISVENEITPAQQKTEMSSIDLSIKQIRSAPALGGEIDLVKVVQLLPGVHGGNEGSSGLYVRGGSPDQNLILIDDAPIYNASHLFGFVSVFNTDAIHNVNLVKGGFPARYGGRLSSVVDISMKEGNRQKFEGRGSIGVLASRLTLEGPILSKRTSFLVSARRTYLDLVTRPFWQEDFNLNKFHFYDANIKVNHTLSDRNRLYLSFYRGSDQFAAKDLDLDTELGWGNTISTFRWNHLFNKKLFSNTTLIYSKYKFETTTSEERRDLEDNVVSRFDGEYFSGVRDMVAKIDFDYLPNPLHQIKFGAAATRHRFSPGISQYVEQQGQRSILDTLLTPTGDIDSWEYNFYAEDDIHFTRRFSVNAGVHAALYYTGAASYRSVEPRISARLQYHKNWAFKASFVNMTQNIHLLTNSGVGLPTDLWVPATDKIKPQESTQLAVGVAGTTLENRYEVSVEGYYKKMDRLIEYQEGANFLNLAEDWQDQVAFGDGTSYGVEFFVHKKSGTTTGWLGYTLSKTEREFPELNFGQPFPYRYDRRHDLKMVVNHRLSDAWELSGNWVFGTGNAITLAATGYLLNDPASGRPNLYAQPSGSHFRSRNGHRMSANHRLDLALRYHVTSDSGREHSFSLSIYNAYNRRNPYFIYYSYDGLQPTARQVTLFPILPSISYSFVF